MLKFQRLNLYKMRIKLVNLALKTTKSIIVTATITHGVILAACSTKATLVTPKMSSEIKSLSYTVIIQPALTILFTAEVHNYDSSQQETISQSNNHNSGTKSMIFCDLNTYIDMNYKHNGGIDFISPRSTNRYSNTSPVEPQNVAYSSKIISRRPIVSASATKSNSNVNIFKGYKVTKM